MKLTEKIMRLSVNVVSSLVSKLYCIEYSIEQGIQIKVLIYLTF